MTLVCVRRCPHTSHRPDHYLRHLSECDKVAPWIKEWAGRVAKRPDWRVVVGLRP